MGKLLGILVVLAILFILGPLFVMLGWYLFMVPVFGLPTLTFLQALGFMMLAAAFKAQIKTS